MMKRNFLLLLDSIVNLILGLLLIIYSARLAGFLGVPVIESAFYPNILGGVLIGIALALLAETISKNSKLTSGLGLFGAILINLCGGMVLLFWLIFGDLNLPVRGEIFLWSLDILLILISSLELFGHFKKIAE
jgi:hypothetical protein